uniref:Uncharacterized protein n=1 Tax=Anopheles atroparvus TaxID=41427 RepID=A0AAG5CT22_ANOAO
MKHSLLLLPLAGLITLATAQYGPAPPRLNIPGAIALPPIREERLLPQQPPQENRPAPIPRAQIPERFFATDKEPQRFAAERPQPQQQQQQPAPKQYRPAPQQQQQSFRQPQQQHFQDEDRRPAPQHQQPARVHSQAEQDRKRKPVAQILRKWRDEHEDGSITWGFENDDGSFKEETIGIDCVTRGRYGYVDPDGEKREYNYETGIQCDPNRRDEDEDDNLEVDYQENKAVLPNGVRLDLNNMGKKQSKRPGGQQQQQQQQQQQYYRN